MPLLVDLGGLPTEKENCIFQICTHSLLLLRSSDVETTHSWHHLMETHKLPAVAELYSELEGVSSTSSRDPFLQGTITGLIRRRTIQNPLFDELIERIVTLFSPYTPTQLEAFHLSIAPTSNIVHISSILQDLAPNTKGWTPEILKHLLTNLPAQKELAVYGRGPNWLYAALAIHGGMQAFYQFDARLGWVVPPPLHIGVADQSILSVKVDLYEAMNVLTIHSVHEYLDYIEAKYLAFPSLPGDKGLILSGKLPLWLVTALARFYNEQGVAWIACFQPQLGGAVVIASRVATYAPGDFISLSRPTS